MPYILSKLANAQIYTKYAKGTTDNLNIAVKKIKINGGADVTDKNFITPTGVLTQVTDNDLEILKENKDFQRHLEKNHIEYFGAQPNVEKQAEKLTKDNSRPLTPADYTKKGKKAPEVSTS